jgi:WD40 repeat protein
MRAPHTIHYSNTYQVLLSAGYEKKINIFEINHKYLETNLKGQLLGHENLITSFTLVKNTPMVCSSDDKGKVKIWDLRNFKCVQTLDFRDKTIITKVLDMV